MEQESHQTLDSFAKHLGIERPLLSHYLNGRNKPSYKYAVQIARKLKDDYILTILGFKKVGMDQLPEDFRLRLEDATNEVNSTLGARGLTGEMPEAEKITIEIFEKWGFKYTEKKKGN